MSLWMYLLFVFFFFFSSRRRHTRCGRDWSSDVCSSDLGLDRLLAITVLAISWTDIALAALAYQNDVGSTVRARSIIEPWTITIAAFALASVPVMVRRGDGLIIAYGISTVARVVASSLPLIES